MIDLERKYTKNIETELKTMAVDSMVDLLNKDRTLPNNCIPLRHQVAGHFGFLQTNDGYILKPVQSPPRGEREHNFFKRIFKSTDLNEDERELKNLLPHYRGSFVHSQVIYIGMDNLAHGIEYPAVGDFKIGRQTCDPEATLETVQRKRLKYEDVEQVGFQLIGMRVFDEVNRSFKHLNKVFGRSLSRQDIIHGLALFYQFHSLKPRLNAVKQTIDGLECIQRWFEKQSTYHFYSSSVIVVYNALAEGDATKSTPVRVKMADFAHSFPAANGNRDENYLFGLNNLIKHLELLTSEEYIFKDVLCEGIVDKEERGRC